MDPRLLREVKHELKMFHFFHSILEDAMKEDNSDYFEKRHNFQHSMTVMQSGIQKA